MLRVEALPADDGDCLWVEWDHEGRWHRMLIDGGRGGVGQMPAALAERFACETQERRQFDLVVCTHLDADHIGGLLALLTAPPPGFRAGDIWFNGRHHLTGDVLGPQQGSALSALLYHGSAPWNAHFGGGPVVVPRSGPLPDAVLPGLRLTLLSPTQEKLRDLARVWPEAAVRAERAEPGYVIEADVLGDRDAGIPFGELASASYLPDTSPANGSSIAFIAEHTDGSRVLFAADAHAEVLHSSLRRLRRAGAHRVDLCKAPHHGSKHNLSPELLAALDCRHWLISTSGARHGHPDRRALARILHRYHQPVLWFNYSSAATAEFASAQLAARHGANVISPPPGRPGLVLTVAGGHVRLG